MGSNTDPAAHRRRKEPLKINENPNSPGANVRKGDSLTNWDIVHKDRGHAWMGHISPERWREIFGK